MKGMIKIKTRVLLAKPSVLRPDSGYPPRQAARRHRKQAVIAAACGAALELRRMPR